MTVLLLSVLAISDQYRTARWLTRGIGSELLTNLCGRGGTTWRRVARQQAPLAGNGTLAIVTGATGGIGSEVSAGLAASGYVVLLAARDRRRGEALARSLRAEGGKAEFVEFHAQHPESATSLARAVGNRPVGILINNAGAMSIAKGDIVRINYVGPALLTVALLPSLRRHPAPRVVNVGSSSHLRAASAEPGMLERTERDRDLSAYAQSKLALMQFSTLLRTSLPWLTVVDAHPGLVWVSASQHASTALRGPLPLSARA